MRQLALFGQSESGGAIGFGPERARIEARFAPIMREELALGRLVSYVGNKSVPLLRLYRYKEAFSLGFVEEFIRRFLLDGDDYILDPFCGMGTTLVAAMKRQVPSVGIDKLPLATFVADALIRLAALEPGVLYATYDKLRARVADAEPARVAGDVSIMKVAFVPEILEILRKWKSVIDDLETPLREVFLLLFFSILEPCSYTSKDGQFLRLRRDKPVADPGEVLGRKVMEAERDLRLFRQVIGDVRLAPRPEIITGDARALGDMGFDRPPTAVITSPPYANRYDYTRTYSLELCFHFVRNFEELKALRFGILRSHIESRVEENERPPHPAIEELVDALESQGRDLNNPRIPHMLTAYFVDMRQVIRQLGAVLAPGAKVAMVVDNVRFGGELVPVDLVLCEMAEEFGFKVTEVIVARYKGNSSQQMGKYGRVPVRESVVVWEKDR